MRGPSALDGQFVRFGSLLADTALLGVLWLFFSIPLFTVGAATSALFYVSTRRVSDREGYIAADFWASFRQNFGKATALWLGFAAAGAATYFNVFVAALGHGVGVFLLPFHLAAAAHLLLMMVFAFPLCARFEIGKLGIVRQSFFLAVRHMPTALACVGIMLVVVAAAASLPPLFFLGPGAYAMLSSPLIMRVFRRYRPDIDPDPQAEAAQREAKIAEARKTRLKIKSYELKNAAGMRVLLTNYGATVIKIIIPAAGGETDVVRGFDAPEDYMGEHPFFGAVCGRVANRIARGRFALDGREAELELNDGKHHLHGGTDGFSRRVWDTAAAGENSVEFALDSPDGDSGYPGALRVRVRYELTEGCALRIEYRAAAETRTVANLTNHSYFNLGGPGCADALGHELEIRAGRIVEVDGELIPTGRLADVGGTAFDFRSPKPVGRDIKKAGELSGTGGYDHCYVLDGGAPAASLFCQATGIRMTVRTDSPGLQLYTGNSLGGSPQGKGARGGRHSALCLETQLFPDSPNRPSFPSCVVEKGAPQEFFTEYGFEW